MDSPLQMEKNVFKSATLLIYLMFIIMQEHIAVKMRHNIYKLKVSFDTPYKFYKWSLPPPTGLLKII